MVGSKRNHRLIALLAIGSGLLKLFPVLVSVASIAAVDTAEAPIQIILLASSTILLILGGVVLFSGRVYLGCILLLAACVIRIPFALRSPPMPDLYIDLLLVAYSIYFLIRRRVPLK